MLRKMTFFYDNPFKKLKKSIENTEAVNDSLIDICIKTGFRKQVVNGQRKITYSG